MPENKKQEQFGQAPKDEGKYPKSQEDTGNKKDKKKKKGKKDKKYTPNRNYPNDPFYYAQNEQKLKNMASFNWSDTVGSNPYNGVVAKQYRVPGVMKFNYMPTLGCFSSADVKNNEITRAADAFFNSMSQGYTGSVPFEAADLIMFVLGAAQIFVKIEEGRRAYGCMKYASLFNSFMPKQLVNACGLDYDSLNSNLADFREKLDKIIDQCNKWFAVPKAFSILKRWIYLATNVMTDAPDSEKAQFYVYKANRWMKVDTTLLNTGTSLVLTGAAEVETADQYFDTLNSLISALRGQDTNNIFGSLRRVYSEDEFYKAEGIDDKYSTPILHEQVILEQIHNITLVPNPHFVAPRSLFTSTVTGSADYISASVVAYQNEGFICTSPVTDVSAMDITIGEDAIVDVLVDGYPGSQVFVEATANIVGRRHNEATIVYDRIITGTATATQGKFIYPRAEIISSVQIYTSDDAPLSYTSQVYNSTISLSTLEVLAAMSTFNYGLMTKAVNGDRLILLSELTNFGHISYDSVATLNQNTFYTLLGMPVYSKSVTK